MSRSNPTETVRNPSTRWFEWHGTKGQVYYYDKEAKKRVMLDLPFTFLLLDELATVRGYHEASNSGIFANEVRDTRQDALVVRAFEGGELASGFYKDIRDRVAVKGGYFQASCYIAYKDGEDLKIGNFGFNGAALSAWSEFKKQCPTKPDASSKHRPGYLVDAVTIHGYEDRKKGATDYRIPTFALKAVGNETNLQAVALDSELQDFLKNYLSRTRTEQANVSKAEAPAPEPARQPAAAVAVTDGFEDEDIPF